MRILSLPKYQMTLKEWLRLGSWFTIALLSLVLLYDSCHKIYMDDLKLEEQYRRCHEVCFPHPVAPKPMTAEGLCICNNSLEYKKP